MTLRITAIIGLLLLSLFAISPISAQIDDVIDVDCSICHLDLSEAHDQFAEEYSCQDCHGRFMTNLGPLGIRHESFLKNVDEPDLDCVQCHDQGLGVHNALGEEPYVCQICHDSFKMKPHALNGTLVSDETITNLCGNCHTERYVDASLGIHGTHGLNYADLDNINCVGCHDPHVSDLPEIETLPPTHPPERISSPIEILFPPTAALVLGALLYTYRFNKKAGDVES
jgi:hypothetical protein